MLFIHSHQHQRGGGFHQRYGREQILQTHLSDHTEASPEGTALYPFKYRIIYCLGGAIEKNALNPSVAVNVYIYRSFLLVYFSVVVVVFF